MISIFMVKCRMLIRKPWMVLILTVSIIGFAFLVGMNFEGKSEVPVFSQLSKDEANELLERLNESDTFEYIMTDQKEALDEVRGNESELAIELSEQKAKMFVASESGNASLIYYELMQAYQKDAQQSALIEMASENPDVDLDSLKQGLDNLGDYNSFTVEKEGFRSEDAMVYDARLQGVFGFSLFFVIYTIAYNVVSILTEKKEGIWNRMILSPIRKWEMYVGNLLYSFSLGYVQVLLVFAVFRFGLDYDFYGSFIKTLVILVPYVFSIVSLSILIAGLVKSQTQFNVIMPLVSVSMAMLGGAYWPMEIVSSKLILFLSKLVPLTYGMEALKDATIYGRGWDALLYPAGMMMLMGIVCMAIGIKLFDRKA